MIVLWCNGSTAVFGSACLGSNPGKTTRKSALSSRLFFVFFAEKADKMVHISLFLEKNTEIQPIIEE